MLKLPLLSYVLLVVAGTLRAEANTGSPICQTDLRLANITGPSADRSGMPHRFRFALYANLSEFRTPEISQRGSPPPEPPVAFRSCPLRPHPYWWERGRTSSTQRASPTLAQYEHAIIPAENPPNARPRGRYKRQFVHPNERSDSRLQSWRKDLEWRGAAAERRLGGPRYNTV